MSQANPQSKSSNQEDVGAVEEALEPSSEFESSEEEYIEADELEDDTGLFSRPISSLEEYDVLADETILLDSERSARVFENYFGQHSRSDEPLYEFLDQFDIVSLELDNDIMLELSIEDYDGDQHVNYHEGSVARELVEYLDSESSWSDQTYFMEDEEKLFIRSSP